MAGMCPAFILKIHRQRIPRAAWRRDGGRQWTRRSGSEQATCRRAAVNTNHGTAERLIGRQRMDVGKINKLQAAVAENGVHAEPEEHFNGEPITCAQYQYVDIKHYIEKRLM